MPVSDYLQRLDRAATALGLDLTSEQSAALLSYLEQLQRWNRTYNLTALRDPDEMLVQHVFDSLSVVKPLRDRLNSPDSPKRIVDVGSGGGLPGIVLAITNPLWHIHCVDAVEKKTAFIRQMIGALNLPNLHAHHGRIEALPLFDADVVISRAFASLLDFSELAGVHVGDEGRLAAMKGRDPVEEIEALHTAAAWRVEQTLMLQVPELNAQRCLLWISRQTDHDQN